MEDFEAKQRAKALTPNEENCVRRNRILSKLLKEKYNIFAKEFRFNCNSIKESVNFVENIHQSIHVSTGSAFRPSIKPRPNSNLQQNKQNNSLKNLVYSQSASQFGPKSGKIELIKKSGSLIDFKPKSKSFLALLEPSDYLINLSKFIDHENQVSYKEKARTGSMKTIRNRHDIYKSPYLNKITSKYVHYKEKDVVEWNKYLYTKEKNELKNDPNEFEFKDKYLYDIYIELCEIRDNIKTLPLSKIENLIKTDPVFNKRYKQLLFAKTCNKAPKFDENDFFLPHLNQKYSIEKEKQAIIRENTIKINLNKHLFRPEIETAINKANKFIQELESN